jgi:hypothetical protein
MQFLVRNMSDTFVKALVFKTYVRGLQVPSMSIPPVHGDEIGMPITLLDFFFNLAQIVPINSCFVTLCLAREGRNDR